MEIKVIRTEPISEWVERWWISLPEEQFKVFGFFLEALDGVGLHRRSEEADNLMEADVTIGRKAELTALINDLATWE